MRKSLPITVAIVNDTHVNSKVALSPKVFECDDGQEITPSRSQRWVLDRYEDYVSQVKSLARGTRTYVIMNGDMLDVDAKNRSKQMMSANEVDAVNNAREVLRELTSMADRAFMIRGTEAHVGGSGGCEESLAALIGTERDGRTYSSYQRRIDIGGLLFDVAHHASPGSSTSISPNGPMDALSKKIITYYTYKHERIPDVVLRAHGHRYMDSGRTPARCIMVPSWSLMNSFSHRISDIQVADQIGGLIMRVENGKAQIIGSTVYDVPLPKIWKDNPRANNR